MFGLMEKDLRLIFKKQTILIFFVMALMMGVAMDGSFAVAYLTMIAVIVSVGTISYDEFDNGYAFLMTLPFDRKTYVREKYLFSLLTALAAWCIGVAVYGIGSAVRHSAVDLAGEIPMLISTVPLLYLAAAVMIPLQLKYGSEKSRVVLAVIFGVIAVLVFGAQSAFNGSQNPFRRLTVFLDRQSPMVVLLVITAGCALITCACYLWSIRIMEKKEF